MALSLLGMQPSSVKLFEIRLDQNILCFQGRGDETAGVLLKGTLVLCLSSALSIRSVRMRLTGEKHLFWAQQPNRVSSEIYVKSHEEFFRKTWEFVIPGKRMGETLQMGNYEWPFEHVMPGSLPESVEGLDHNWVIYRMKATIERGLLQLNSYARKHLRLIRTFDPSAPELSHEVSIENVWPKKLQYSMSAPTKGVVFGTAIKVVFKLIPLVKGLGIGEVATELVETQVFSVPTSKPPERRVTGRVVLTDEWKLSEDMTTEDIDGQDGYLVHRLIQLPKSLKDCTQSANSIGIKTTHRLVFYLDLINPDGHVSKLSATLPIVIFISPLLPLDDNNDIIQQPNMSAIASAAINSLAPPGYGEHQFDILYSEIDPSGFMTPVGGASGISTPFASQSRSGSTENLASMDGAASADLPENVLQSHLHNLEHPTYGRWTRDRPYHPSDSITEVPEHTQEPNRDQGSPQPYQNATPHASDNIGSPRDSPNQPSSSNILSQRSSTPIESHSPQHLEFSSEDLAKVPSYSTALRSRATVPINYELPNYQAATRIPTIQPPPPEVPNPAHIRRSPKNRTP